MYGWEFPPYISGGLGVACHDITKALSELGVEINFVLPNFAGSSTTNQHLNLINSSKIKVSHQELMQVADYFNESVNLFKIDSVLRPYITEEGYLEQLAFVEKHAVYDEITKSYNLNIAGNYGANLLEEVSRYAYVSGFIARDVEHDLIHTHDWMTVLAGIEARRHSAKPLVYHVHALETDRSGAHTNPEIYNIEKYGLEQADLIIAVSEFTKNNIVRYYGIPPEKIEVVHNAVSKSVSIKPSSKLVKRLEGQKIILFLGRVTHQKGPDYFLEAAAKVLKQEKNISFVIAGNGDMTMKLIERAAELKIGNKVHFTGFLNREEVEALFQASDAYVMSSVSEPFGLSSLEAVLFDVPVIMSKQSGVSEVLHNALKVDFWDVDELANQMVAVVKYPALHKQLMQSAAEELKSIQWENSARKINSIYARMIGN
jgi:glycosyltransferase involved in cell wall biosynthesis